jgi:nitroreductase
MRDFFQLVNDRCSIREFTANPVEPAHREAILRAAAAAPSAGNLQSFEIFEVTNLERRLALSRSALNQRSIAQAPVVLVFCAVPERSAARYGRRGTFYSIQDATIACAYAQLAVAALGLGSVWVGAFEDREVVHILGASAGVRPVSILPVGHPAKRPERSPRRPLDELARRLG